MASKNLIAGIIAGLVIVGVVLGGVIMTIPLNNSDVVEPVEQNEQNEPAEPNQDEPVEQPEQPAEKKDPVWYVTSGGTTEPEEEVAEPTIDQIPTHIAIGRDLVVSGTADGFKGEQLIVGLISDDCPIDCFYENADVDENGSWTVTFDTTDVTAREYTVMLATETMELVVSGPITVVVGAPTLNTIPNETSFGQELVISGTAVGYTGETVTAEIYSNTHIFGKTKTATVDENGVWEVDASDLPADDYNASFKFGDAVFAFQTFKIVMEEPTIDETPEQVTIGQEITVSGTAVSYKGKTMHVEINSYASSSYYDVHRTTTVDENGLWSITVDTSNFAEDSYSVYPYIGIDEIDLGIMNLTHEQNLEVSGTAVGREGERLTVLLVPDEHIEHTYARQRNATVDETGSWTTTFKTSNTSEGPYHVFAQFETLDVTEDEISFVTERETPTVNEIPEQITRGYDFVVSGTAVSYKGESVKVDVVSQRQQINEAHEVATVDENGMWSITIDISDFMAGNYTVSVSVGQLALESKTTKIVFETPTIDQYPEHITIGQEVVISGTAVSYKGGRIHVDLVSDEHSYVYDAETTTTVDENGFWTVTIDTSNFAEDLYWLDVYIGQHDLEDIEITVTEPVQQEPETTKQIEEPLVTESLEELL